MGVLDRYGEPLEDHAEPESELDAHRDRCHEGLLGEDAEGRPIPCLVCRPHLRRQLERRGSR